MTRTKAPLKTRDFAAILHRSYIDSTSAQTAETTKQAESTAKEAAVHFFAMHEANADKITSLFQKAVRLDPSELTDSTQRKQFVAHLQKTIPEARAWAPPACPAAQPRLQGPSALEIETARIAPVLPDDTQELYLSFNRVISDACRQNPANRMVKIEGLAKAIGILPEGELECYVSCATEAQSFAIEELIYEDPNDDGAVFALMHELKHWLLNCGASEVSITARRPPHKGCRRESSEQGPKLTCDAPPDGLTAIGIADFDIALRAPPKDKLLLLPLQMATQRLTHHLENIS